MGRRFRGGDLADEVARLVVIISFLIALTHVAALEKTPAEADHTGSSAEENARTIRPQKSPAAKPPIPLAKPPPDEMHGIVEDYSDLVGDDEGILESKVADFKVSIRVLLIRLY